MYALKPLTVTEKLLAARMRDKLGVTEQQEIDFAKRADPDGGVTCSIVELVRKHDAARRARSGKAA